MKRFKGTKGIIILAILACLIIGYYIHLNTRNYEPPEIDTEVYTFVQETLLRNLAKDYPPTPREVVKYAADLNRCYYNEEHTDEELAALVKKERELYDEELLNYNSESGQLAEITKEINAFKEEEYYISEVSFSQSIDVQEFEADGREWACLYAKYKTRQKTYYYLANYTYLLRKDDAGHWKIYGWKVEDDDE